MDQRPNIEVPELLSMLLNKTRLLNLLLELKEVWRVTPGDTVQQKLWVVCQTSQLLVNGRDRMVLDHEVKDPLADLG